MSPKRSSFLQKSLMLVLSDFFPPGIHAVFTDRHCSFSLAGGQETLTPEQETAAGSCLSIPQSVFVFLRQVHGSRIVVYDRGAQGPRPPLAEADGCLSASSRCWLGVRTADCLPVYLCDVRKRCVGIVHAGWRGTREGIARQAVDRMEEAFGSDSADLIAVLGPCIRPCCYAVGQEFCDLFPEDIQRQGRRFVLDLAGANVRQLLARGLAAARIYDGRLCTCCDQRFFSYRREGPGCGRNLALIVME